MNQTQTSSDLQVSEIDSLADFESMLDAMQLEFDLVVESGTDQELFISGYLSGHFSLVASQCCLQNLTSLNLLDNQMQENLRAAFAQGELEPEDQQQVLSFWATLVKKYS